MKRYFVMWSTCFWDVNFDASTLVQEIELRDQLLLRQFKNDVALSAASWKKNLLSTMSYCFTEAKPRVAWLPGVTDASVRPFVDLTKRQLEVNVLRLLPRQHSDFIVILKG